MVAQNTLGTCDRQQAFKFKKKKQIATDKILYSTVSFYTYASNFELPSNTMRCSMVLVSLATFSLVLFMCPRNFQHHIYETFSFVPKEGITVQNWCQFAPLAVPKWPRSFSKQSKQQGLLSRGSVLNFRSLNSWNKCNAVSPKSLIYHCCCCLQCNHCSHWTWVVFWPFWYQSAFYALQGIQLFELMQTRLLHQNYSIITYIYIQIYI